MLGRLLARSGRLPEAAAEFEQLIELEEARPAGADRDRLAEAYVNLCDVQLSLRDLGGAERACTRSLAMFPGEADPHYNMAMLRMLLGDPDGALDYLEEDVALGDRDHEYLLGDEVFLPLRGDPRFQGLVETMRAEPR
jgi:Flp pilus assembly protein TadD